MSHSSGISVSPNLLSAFADASRTEHGTRILQVQIVNETSLELVKSVEPVKDWEKDFDLVPSVLNEREACYVLFRTDERNPQNVALWYVLCYVPDKCKVRDKMVYASTRSNLKSGLGANNIVEEIFGTSGADFNCAGFAAWKKHQSAGVPLTELEIQKNEELEQGLFKGGAGTSTAYVHGVSFPVDDDVLEALDSFVQSNINYVQVGIDPKNERIVLKHTGSYEINDVPSHFPTNEPRFHFYKWIHDYEGDHFESVVYCYSCPSSPVKLRMLYSTSKANLASVAESRGITTDLKLEITNGPEFNESDISSTLHPPKAEQKKTFAKPKPRGARQLIRNKE